VRWVWSLWRARVGLGQVRFCTCRFTFWWVGCFDRLMMVARGPPPQGTTAKKLKFLLDSFKLLREHGFRVKPPFLFSLFPASIMSYHVQTPKKFASLLDSPKYKRRPNPFPIPPLSKNLVHRPNSETILRKRPGSLYIYPYGRLEIFVERLLG
jgi:hypothetical protein